MSRQMGVPDRQYMGEPEPGPSGAVAVLAWCLRHWVLVLLVIALMYGVFHTYESENPRPGYYDTGEDITKQQCYDQGGEVVDDVCYLP